MLDGRALVSVNFIFDYIQLQFDDMSLAALTPLRVNDGQRWLEPERPGYRDALCGRITKVVRHGSFEPDREIKLEFDDLSVITISLRPEDYHGPEAATLTGTFDGSSFMGVW